MKNMISGDPIYPPKVAPGVKKKITYPPANGVTFEKQQRSRQALIARKHAAQQSAHLTASRRGLAIVLFLVVVLPAVALVVIGGR